MNSTDEDTTKYAQASKSGSVPVGTKTTVPNSAQPAENTTPPAAADPVSLLGRELFTVDAQIRKLVDKYLETDMPAKTFMHKQTPMLMHRSVLVAKIKVLEANDSERDNSTN